MTKTIVIYTNRKTNKEYIIERFINEGSTAVLVDSEGETHLYALSTLKRNFKRSEKDIEIEEPKAEEPKSKQKPNLIHQKTAVVVIRDAYNNIVGRHEEKEEDLDVEGWFNEVYNNLEGFCDHRSSCALRFAGKAFIREQIAKLFRADGYKVPKELLKVPEKKRGSSKIVDGERVNLRIDDAAKVVTVRAFTGMLIGVFKVEKETKSTIIVKAAKGVMKFSKATGIQTNAKNPKFANRIDI